MSGPEYEDDFLPPIRFIWTCHDCGAAVVPDRREIHDAWHERNQ